MKTNASLLVACSLVLAGNAFAQGQLYSFSNFGDRAISLGDIDGDGHPDVLASRAGTYGAIGEARVISTRQGTTLASFLGNSAGDGFGLALASLGDVDLDGVNDFAIASPLGLQPAGTNPMVELRSGASGALLRRIAGAPGSLFGTALASAGDINGDLVPDLLVGSPAGGASSEGMVQIFSGASGSVLRTHLGAGGAQGAFGAALTSLGDVDSDGVPDYACADPKDNSFGPGSVVVFSGSSGATIRTHSGLGGADNFGFAIASASDVDGDGIQDLLVGSPNELAGNFISGAAWLYSGATGAVIHHVPSASGLYFGRSLAAMGDWDGDGTPDFAVHYPWAYIGGVVKNAGRAMIHSGASGAVLGAISLGALGPIAPAGDVNLDGAQDLLVSGGLEDVNLKFSSLFLGNCPQVQLYCTPKVNSLGCTPALTFSGAPSLSIGDDLTLKASRLYSNKPGLVLWSLAPAATPFGGGLLCVAPPVVRTSGGNSGGSGPGNCSGSLNHTFTKAYLASHGLTAGTQIYAQLWLRDPGFAPPNNVGLTSGLAITLWP
ncbi:MAG TPA: integrin alpha [Planctomycetota bacterium]|nr:integrin alpha [Planctomycetota bacterium]